MRLVRFHTKQPIPDWNFEVEPETILRATDADELLEKIVAYRANNGQPAGNPEHEVALSMIAKYPHLVKDSDSDAPAIDPLWSWVNRLWREAPAKRADEELAKKRAAICKDCPCACAIPENEELERRAYLLAMGELPLTTRCSHHLWHNGLAVTLLEPSKWARPKAPLNCWAETVEQPPGQ